MRTVMVALACACAALGALAVGPSRVVPQARACGGLFCNSAQPVNQAAERILFVENGDGTVTAVIEIKYEGPAESFSWVLPVPGVPEVAVSSVAAFDRLQGATNPQYTLNTTFEEGCDGGNPRGGFGSVGSPAPQAPTDGGESEGPGVVVVAAGTVGPFDYEVIMVNPQASEPADVAITWLTENGYDVGALGPEVLGPYLAEQLNLLAFRLSKTSSSGSIRPIVITYASELPFIPIRPTAVAANDDMGVMVWVAGAARAVPDNYKGLELNEALIDWFNPMRTYNDVVSAAADEAGGQGFVTELAADSDTLDGTLLQPWETQEFNRIVNQQYASPAEFLIDAMNMFGGWDGFEDAVRSSAVLPADITFSDFLNCPACYANNPAVMFDDAGFRVALYEDVYRPVLRTQELLLSRPYVTRLYTTMSAEEMTMDPAFNFNADLDDLSNVHTADQIIECDGGFRIVLPQGDTVQGEQQGTWPIEIGDSDQPAARKILQLATEGQGEVVRDNSKRIADFLASGEPTSATRDGGSVDDDPDGGTGGTLGGADDDGCSYASALGGKPGRASSATVPALFALLALAIRVRRRR